VVQSLYNLGYANFGFRVKEKNHPKPCMNQYPLLMFHPGPDANRRDEYCFNP
jgi:hypothetical protein